jgi:hypothetical protein
MSESDYGQKVRETQEETSTADEPDQGSAPPTQPGGESEGS